MIQFETTKATILFVEVPEDVTWVKITSTGNIVCKVALGDFSTQKLPDGTWQFITLLKDAREEHAREIIPMREGKFFSNSDRSKDKFTALEVIHSLANSLGVKGNTAILIENK